ncbi:MAG: PIG-L family deacetylase [Ktedonobacteraceae bacterium]|nr:PIG-L family deacetylase [Ktedonobacteraceae bacterium]
MREPLKLMSILAHPDDESLAFGGTLAKYAEEGVETSLIVATRGERGWFGEPGEYPGPQALGRIREIEVREAATVLGVARLDFLDYMDGEVDRANESEIIAKIVYLLRQVRPQVVVTFGPDGLYGHPDHIAISQFATSAVMCAANPACPYARELEPHTVSKLYYRTAPADWFRYYMPIFGELVMRVDGRERRAYSWDHWVMTTRLDTSVYWRRVVQAVRCHRTQIPAEEVLNDIPEELHMRLWGTQEYYRVFSLVNGGRREERDLFEGIRLEASRQAFAQFCL